MFDWEQYRRDREKAELENAEQHHGKAGLIKVSYKWVNASTSDVVWNSVNGKTITRGELWEFTTLYKYANKLANLKDINGKCLVGYGAKKYERCLELGCDWGYCFPVFEECFDGVFGVEINTESVKRGQEFGRLIHLAPLEHTPYRDNWFDCVMSNHVMEHGSSPGDSLKEVYRVTKPNGYSLHTLPCRQDMVVEGESLTHKSNITYKDWLKEFENHGFEILNHFFMWAGNQEDWTIIAKAIK